MTRATLADSVTAFEYRAPAGARATLYRAGPLCLRTAWAPADWTPFDLRFRAPRFDAGFNKVEPAFVLEAAQRHRRSSQRASSKVRAKTPCSADEDRRGPAFVVVRQGPFSMRNARHEPADFEQLTLPKASGGDTNEKELKDLVALGKETFTQLGCEACHLVEPNSTAVSSGPNLFGLFRVDPRTREVVEGGEGHRFQIKANREYLHRSVRAPADQLAVAESGATQGQPYLPVMPAFPKEILSDAQIDAIGDYLATLNEPRTAVRSPGSRRSRPPRRTTRSTDGLQWLVGDEVRLQRGPLPGTSGRAIHVGNPNGVNYSFDPRLLADREDLAGRVPRHVGRVRQSRQPAASRSATTAARSVSAIANTCSRR